MREKWRAEEDYPDSTRRRDRGTKDRRQNSPAPRGERDTGGLKIKGRAVAESAPGSPSTKKTLPKKENLGGHYRRDWSRSPQGRRARDELRSKRPRESSADRDSVRTRRRQEADLVSKRRRTRSRSFKPEISDIREERRRHRSPAYSGRTDRFRPRSRSRSRSRIGRRERRYSPQRPIRGDYYSSPYLETNNSTGRFGDSYVPGSRRGPSPSAYQATSSRRRSRSGDRHKTHRKSSPPRKRLTPEDRYSSKDRDRRESLYRSSPHPRDSSRRLEEVKRPRRESRPHSRSDSRKPAKRRKSSYSPVERPSIRGHRTKMQQSPPRPIQSLVNDGSRPPAQLQRIPSFDATQGQSVNMNEAFPMHGMKASEVHGSHRHNRPPHLNTQQSYNNSPQWTPTSSHHGSPHSGSPFSQGRGGWNAQPQHYQNESG